MAFENWFIEFTEPGPGTLTTTGSSIASGGGIVIPSSGGASSSQTQVTVTAADLNNLQAQLFAAVAAEASARAGADSTEISVRSSTDNTLFDLCAALHAADAQIYAIVINGTGTGGGGGGGVPIGALYGTFVTVVNGSGTNSFFQNPVLVNPILHNGVNYGVEGFSSPGKGATSEQFGFDAEATGDFAVALGPFAQAFGPQAIAIGFAARGIPFNCVAIGGLAEARGTNSIAIGPSTLVNFDHDTSAALGAGAFTTQPNQIVLGNLTHVVYVPGNSVMLPTGAFFTSGTGTPEGAVSAPVSSLYLRIDGTSGSTVYTKVTGLGPTGWSALASAVPVVDDDSLALNAWALAQAGTNTGTAAFNLAQEALNIAIVGTTMTALDTTWIGTLNSEVSLHTNWIGSINTEVGLHTTWIGTVTNIANSGSQLAVLLYNWFGTTHGIPTGGNTGQVLTKNSNTNYDVIWATPTSGTGTSGTSSGTFTGTTVINNIFSATVMDIIQVQVFS